MHLDVQPHHKRYASPCHPPGLTDGPDMTDPERPWHGFGGPGTLTTLMISLVERSSRSSTVESGRAVVGQPGGVVGERRRAAGFLSE